MTNSKNIITVITIVVVVALLIGTFIYFGGSQSAINSDLEVQVSANSINTQNVSRELLTALSSLKDLNLDASFLKDLAFLSLQDYSKDIQDEPLGRDNPFLPVQ